MMIRWMDNEIFLLISIITSEFCFALTSLSRHRPLYELGGRQRLQKLLETMLIIGCWI